MLAIVAINFFLKLLAVVDLRTHPLLQPDSGLDTTAYVTLAGQVLAGNLSLGPGVYFVSPLYIYFLAGALALVQSFTAVRVLQVALGAIGTGLIFLTAREWFGARAAWIAAGLATFTGLVTFYESIILQAAIDPVLTAAALWCLTLALTRNPARRSPLAAGREGLFMLAAGMLFGIDTLNRPNMLVAAAAVGAALLVTRRLRLAMFLAAGIAAGMAPVAIRNAVVARQLSFVSSHGGLNFYIGNGEGATGFYRQIPGISPTIGGQEQDARRVAERALGRTLTDAETSDYFFGLAWTEIREHPAAAAGLFVRKLLFVFHAQHVALPHSYPFYVHDERSVLRFFPVGPWLLLPLGLVGLVLPLLPTSQAARGTSSHLAHRTSYVIWATFVPGYAVGVALFFVAERYRLPLLVPLAIGAGAAIDSLAGQRGRARVAAAGAVAVLFIACNWPVNVRDGRWEEGLRLAQQLVIKGRPDEADAWVPRLEPREPRPGATRYGVGMQYVGMQQAARALPHLARAHELDPDQPSTDYALGQALLGAGRAAEAIPHLRRGFESGTAIPEGGYDYAAALQATGDFAAAAQAIGRIQLNDRADADAWLRLGRLAMSARAPDAAEPIFRRAVAMRPDRADTHQHLGLDLLLLGRVAEAAASLGEAVRLDPRDVESLSRLAYCEVQIGRRDAARQHAEAALAIDPANELAQKLMVVLK